MQDTFILHLNFATEIQKQVNHDRASSVPEIQNRYSAGLFIHTVGGLAETAQKMHRSLSSNVSPKYPSCPSFRPQAMNAIIEDCTGFNDATSHQDYCDFEHELNSLEDNLDFHDPQSLWSFAVHGIDLDDVPFYAINTLKRAVLSLVDDFSTGNRGSFNITQPCAICGGKGHTFDSCPGLMNNDKIKAEYIRLRLALRRLFSSLEKINAQSTDVNSLRLSSLARLSALPPCLAGRPHTLPSSPSGSEASLVSALQGMRMELAKLNSLHTELTKFNSVVSNILAVQDTSATASAGNDDADDDDTTSTHCTDDSLVAYLNADKRSDFYLGRG